MSPRHCPDELAFEWTCDVDDEDGWERPSGDETREAVEVVCGGHAERACEHAAEDLGDAIMVTNAQHGCGRDEALGPSWDCEPRGGFVPEGAVPA